MRYLSMVKIPHEGRPETWSKIEKEEFIKNNEQVIKLAKETLISDKVSTNKIMKTLVSDLKDFATVYANII